MHEKNPLVGGDENSGRAVILIHGRGGSSEELINFAENNLPKAKFIALRADGNVWYPKPFMVPRVDNEPYLSKALEAIDKAIKDSGFPKDKIILLGFSQGACLAAEYAARNPKKYGGIIAFSGGLIGYKVENPENSMQSTKMIFGCSEEDPYIPTSRVKDSIEAFKFAGASVQEYIYPGKTHMISDKEISLAYSLIEEI